MKYLHKLHPGEPYFFVRAQDVYSVNIVRLYADNLETAGDHAGSVEVRKIADAMRDWQIVNPDKVKHPD